MSYFVTVADTPQSGSGELVSKPWEGWIPGVLSARQARALIDRKLLLDTDHSAVTESSIDLHLSDEAYVLNSGSIKPCGGNRYARFIRSDGERVRPDDSSVFQLHARKTYVFKLRERINGLKNSPIHGEATAKSSVGRVDVLARLAVDGERGYESFEPKNIDSGDMYLEVTPITFPVSVQVGASLSQLRLFYGKPASCAVAGPEYNEALLRGTNDYSDASLSVDLTNTRVSNVEAAAFRAKASEANSSIQLWADGSSEGPDPCQHWQILQTDAADDEERRLTIEQGAFYILRSKERLAIPQGIAVYCRATDETIGEMRIHYAGFVHPHFGLHRADRIDGTPLIFEVRGHDVNVNLIHGEKLARLTFYRMSEDAAAPEKPQPYNEQTLKLSKYFGPWPEKLEVARDGRVTEGK